MTFIIKPPPLIKPLLLLFCFVPFVEDVEGQSFKVSGKVTNASLEPLSYVSVAIKNQKTGTTTKADGSYELLLTENRYEFVFTMIGYRQQVVEVVVRNNDVKQNVILETAGSDLGEVEVKAVRRDRAEEIIRNVIRNKEKLLENASSYSAELYIRATQENDVLQRKKKINPINSADSVNRELMRMSMAEITLKLDYQYPNKIKEERTGVKVRGNSESLFFLTATDGDFSFYRNLVRVPALSQMPFLSPISYSGLLGYKFKTVSIRKEKEHKIYTIRITPVKLGNALVEGEVEVLDSAWVLLKTHFEFPKFHMPEYDYFSVDQQYEHVDNKAWIVTRQEFAYAAKAGKNRMNGRTVVQFKELLLNPVFPPRHFGNEVSATSQQAYDRDSTFWTQVRTEPLTEKELRFIRYKDSVFSAHNSRAFHDSIDKIFNRVTWKKVVLLGQGMYRRDLERTIEIGPLASVYQPLQFGGARLGLNGQYRKIFASRKNVIISGDVSYGIRNKDLKGSMWVTRMYNPFNRGAWAVDFGREFTPIFAGDAWINQLKRSNVFEHDHVTVAHELEIVNGLYLRNELEFGVRRSVEKYRTNAKWDSLVDGLLPNNQAVAFPGYNAFYNSITLKYTPRQQYIREPKEKVILGSRWPTFYVNWRKGIPGVFKSVVNFDYLEFGMQQELKLGLAGISRYKLFTGSFYNTKDLRLVDYKWMRQGDPILFSNPTISFQLLDSTFPSFRRFYEGHYLHHFNGAILNKVPLFKRLNLMEVAGGGILYLPERNLRYVEGFIGVEKVFRFWTEKFKLGVYMVGSVANQFNNPFTIKVGIEHFDKRKNSWYE